MIRITALLLLTLIPAAGACAQVRDVISRVPDDLLELYRHMNDREERLEAYRDSDEALAAKLIQLQYMNEVRKSHGAPPLRLDIFASRLANRMSMEAGAKKFAGHWNTAGEKPYHRYAFAGGLDHVSENAAAISTSGSLDLSPAGAVRMMREMYDEFMAERPPNDGHRKTCLDKSHNYVGLGYYITKHEFRYYEEYIDRYLRFYHVDTEARPEEECRVSFKPLSKDHHVYAVVVFYEPFPEPMTPYRINRMGGYDDFTEDNVISIWPWEIAQYSSSRRYDVPLIFPQEGLYYVHIYLDDEEFSGNSASTRDKLQASGIVIRVE